MRPLRLLAALALALTASLTAGTANAAPGDGTLTVMMVDETGAPAPGSIVVYAAGGSFANSAQAQSTMTFTMPAGEYAVVAITPWGGIRCAGVDPCDYYAAATGTADPDGDVVVAAGQDTRITLTASKPASLHKPARVGSPVAIDFSDGMEEMLAYLGGVGGAGLAPTVTWLRNGQPIDGATDDTYVPTGADAGKSVSARLAYTGIALAQFQMITGATVTPRTTNALKISKVPTKTFGILSNPDVKAGNHGKVRVEVTAKDLIVTGRITVTLGDWSQTRSLRNGTARILLPALPPGKYAVQARFLGSSVYSPSTSQPRTLTVTR